MQDESYIHFIFTFYIPFYLFVLLSYFSFPPRLIALQHRLEETPRPALGRFSHGFRRADSDDFSAAVPAFPFPMTDENMQAYESHKDVALWQNLKQGWDWFERHKRPPNVEVRDKAYVFELAGR